MSEKHPETMLERLVRVVELRVALAVAETKYGFAGLLSTIAPLLPILLCLSLFIVFIGVALSLAIGQWLGNVALGFLIGALLQALFALLIWSQRKKIEATVHQRIEDRLQQLSSELEPKLPTGLQARIDQLKAQSQAADALTPKP